MHVSVKWFNQNFNVSFAKEKGGEDFLSIKGCRIVNGQNGPFVSYPSQKKSDGSGYWNHVWASDAFNNHVLKLAQESQPSQSQQKKDDLDGDSIPF